MTTIVNIRHEFCDIYIGREGRGESGYFGNPHVIGYCKICEAHHNRDQCIEAFKNSFLCRISTDPEFVRRVKELKGKRLGCFCKPLNCHGDVYKEWLDNQGSEI